MKCKVYFVNDSAGEFFVSDGELEKTEKGAVLSFVFDGNECAVTCFDGAIVYERRGDTPISMRFKEGAKTELSLGLGDAKGSLPITTEKVVFIDGADGVEIVIRYIFGDETINLRIKARV